MFVLFLVLLVVGLSQLAGRRVGWRRVAVLPLVFGALSFFGVVSAFAEQPLALSAGFALPVSAAYGVMSGIFLGRAIRLWRLAAPHWALVCPA